MLLKDLSEAMGVSGDEAAVRKIILDAIKEHVTDITIDPMGNITAFKKGTGKSDMRVMIAAHMDEIGFMITGFESSGLLRFTNVGGVDDRILPGLRVKIGKKQVPGVVIWKPIHMGYDQSTVKLSNLRIDIGATKKEAAQGKVKRGDRAVFDSTFLELGDMMLRGKAFDDRVGCAMLVDVLQGGPYPVDILAAFTAQEEIGVRGAQVAAQRLKPDMALVLESSPAHDLPDPIADEDEDLVPNPGCKIGQGPVLTVMDSRMITPPRLLNFLKSVGDDNNIPYQLKTTQGGGTDAGAIHLTNGGVASAVISTPCRYIHSPAALLNREDYANGLRLVKAALENLSPDVLAWD